MLTTENIAALTPMPSASTTIATVVKPGARAKQPKTVAKILEHGRPPTVFRLLRAAAVRGYMATLKGLPRLPSAASRNGTDAAVLSHMIVILPPASVMSVNSHVS